MTYLRRIVFISLLIIVGLGAQKGQTATEDERFDIYTDPVGSGRAFVIPITRHFPTAAEMAAAEEDYTRGKEKLLGKRVTTLFGGIRRDKSEVDVALALKLLRRASYYGHPEATRSLIWYFTSKNEMVAEAVARSGKKAKSLWQQSLRYLEERRPIPEKTLRLTEVYGPIGRARAELRRVAEEREKKRAEEEAISGRGAALEDIHVEERKEHEPHALDTAAGAGEGAPLLGGEGLRHRRP